MPNLSPTADAAGATTGDCRPSLSLVTDPLAPQGIDDALSRYVAPVSVVTAWRRGTPTGLLTDTLAVVSRRPAVVSFAVSLTSYAWPAIEQAEHLGIHVPAADQGTLADRFGRTTADGIADPATWRPGPHGVPLLAGCAAWLVARPRQRVHAGSHAIVVCDVVDAAAGREGDVLLRGTAGYLRAAP